MSGPRLNANSLPVISNDWDFESDRSDLGWDLKSATSSCKGLFEILEDVDMNGGTYSELYMSPCFEELP